MVFWDNATLLDLALVLVFDRVPSLGLLLHHDVRPLFCIESLGVDAGIVIFRGGVIMRFGFRHNACMAT